tara:strand:- start:1112 stop:2188 length:1077 start_codon:yes stop_codon:yes gene_type:complete
MFRKKNLILLFFSFFLGLLITEIFLQIINSNKNIKNINAINRFMIFEEGNVFKPYENFFKYHSNKKIRSEVFYKVNKKFLKEYSYEIITNNFGLVQQNNILKNKKSILFLGDSFTEGQGALAWINQFGNEFKNYQLINGGILGTGPKQFENIERHISENFKISKVILLYLGDDMRRSILNINQKTVNCLSNHKNCEGDENFYGYPIRKNDPREFLEKLDKYRINHFKEKNTLKSLRRSIKNFFLELYIIKIPKNLIKNRFYNSKNEKIILNLSAFDYFIKKYNENIIFIQLKQREEILFEKKYETIYAEKFIKNKTNNHFSCDFNNDISNFYEIDGHPNEKGYQSLYECVLKIMKSNI